MKKLLFLVVSILIFYGCDKYETPKQVVECQYPMNIGCENGLVCDVSGKCVYPCEIENYCGDGTCVKDPEINGVAQYHCECAENMEFQVICCPPETSCESYYDHYCSDSYNQTDLTRNVRKGCHIMESCNDSRYCANFVNREEPYTGTEMNYFGVCNPNHECQLRCENDNDCIGENEYCHKTEKTCYLGRHLAPCDGGYFSAVEQKCVESCGSDEECSEPTTKCNNSANLKNGYCVLPCSSDQECENYKWAGGYRCNIELGRCTNL